MAVIQPARVEENRMPSSLAVVVVTAAMGGVSDAVNRLAVAVVKVQLYAWVIGLPAVSVAPLTVTVYGVPGASTAAGVTVSVRVAADHAAELATGVPSVDSTACTEPAARSSDSVA